MTTWLAGVCAVWAALASQVMAQEIQPPTQRATAVLGQAKRPEAMTELLAIYEDYDNHPPEQTRLALARVADGSKATPLLKVTARRLMAGVQARLGSLEAAEQAIDELGYLRDFRVVGPFDNEGKAGLAKELPPERDRMQSPDPHATFVGKERPVAWRDLPGDVVRGGRIPLDGVLRPNDKACAFAETFVSLEKNAPISLWFGSGGASVVYWNGQEVLRDGTYRMAPFADRSATMVMANEGWNRLLVKVCVDGESLDFFVRLGQRDGSPLRPVEVARTTPRALDITAKALPRGVKAPKPALSLLATKGERKNARPADKLALARFLRRSVSDDRATRRAQQLAAQAARDMPSPQALAFAAELATERGDKLAFLQLAGRKFPEHPVTLLLKAELLFSGPVPEDALPVLDKVPLDSPYALAALGLRAAILRDLGLPGAAYRTLASHRARFDQVPSYLRWLAVSAEGASHHDEGISLRKKLLSLRATDAAQRRVLIADALPRQEVASVEEHLDAMRAMRPASMQTLRYVAETYDALGRDDLSLSTYRDAITLAPEDVPLRFAYARALLRAEQPDVAAPALEAVLKLSPQHAAARELLEQLKPRERLDEHFATPSEEILARRDDGGGHSTTVLHQLQVNTVFDNGLGTRFTQVAAQAHDEEGTRALRAQSIQFDPDTQRVDLRLARVYRKDGSQLESIRVFEQQLGEPWYRIYYDTRALVVVFPDLQPGDVVELRYRVDDIAQRNLFSDYYGDLHVFAGSSPNKHHEYVLITPKGRTFYTNQPRMTGLGMVERVDGERRIRHWTVEDVPAIFAEPGMPGLTEVAPYLHVSTYSTWEDVGQWYWGLIHEQLYADASLKAKVAELTAGRKTTVEKVKAIHDWVIDHTRYVGLEFGIHGFLPYRVPLIVQRGFGDCKDKASLLYTMFREAGIDARIVLVRTRRNGAITDLPASLSVFDHAIAYVPELDLFIDGTAEYSGTTELPPGDQGVTVLVVGPESAQLRKTPVLPPSSHSRTRTMQIALDKGGDAVVSAAETLVGSEAASYRSHYEAPGTRSERFERALGGKYPGVKLETLTMSDLSDREQPVSLSYRFRAPRFAKRDGEVLRVSPSGLGDLTRAMASTPTRVHALDLQTRSAYEERRTFALPQGYHATLPESEALSNPFFELSVQFTEDSSGVTAATRFVVKRDRIQASEYPTFRAEIVRADRLLKRRILFAPEGANATPATASSSEHVNMAAGIAAAPHEATR